MQRLLAPRVWFLLAALLGIVAVFVLRGAAGGVVAAAAWVAFFVACFRCLRGEHPEDRTVGTGLFGGGGGRW
jgi:hypothetical protein